MEPIDRSTKSVKTRLFVEHALKRIESDYIEYKKMFDEGFWQLLMTKDISRKLKIKMLFVYLNLYNVFLKLKKII